MLQLNFFASNDVFQVYILSHHGCEHHCTTRGLYASLGREQSCRKQLYSCRWCWRRWRRTTRWAFLDLETYDEFVSSKSFETYVTILVQSFTRMVRLDEGLQFSLVLPLFLWRTAFVEGMDIPSPWGFGMQKNEEVELFVSVYLSSYQKVGNNTTKEVIQEQGPLIGCCGINH